MTTLIIYLSDDRVETLRELALRLHVTPEELIRATVEELLVRSEKKFQQASEFVLVKNTELYKRLA